MTESTVSASVHRSRGEDREDRVAAGPLAPAPTGSPRPPVATCLLRQPEWKVGAVWHNNAQQSDNEFASSNINPGFGQDAASSVTTAVRNVETPALSRLDPPAARRRGSEVRIGPVETRIRFETRRTNGPAVTAAGGVATITDSDFDLVTCWSMARPSVKVYFTQSTFFPSTLAGLPATSPSRHILRHDAASADNSARADSHSGQDESACTDPDVVTNSDRDRRRAGFSFDAENVSIPIENAVFHEMAQSLPMEMCSKQVTVELQLM